MTTDQVLAYIGGLAGLIGMANSLRKTRIDDRTSAVEGLQVLCDQLQTQLDATTKRAKEREAELQASIDTIKTDLTRSRTQCEQQIALLTTKLNDQRETIERQAHQLTQLDRRRTPRSNGDAT